MSRKNDNGRSYYQRIEASPIIKRILIVAPGHLKDQWQRELSDIFEEKIKLSDYVEN
jgi:hypothetical protein